MSHHLQPLIILLLLTIIHLQPTQTTQFNNGFFLTLTKDPQTHQHTTHILIGTTPQLPTKLVVHLSGHSSWLNCNPSSRNPIPLRSLQCSMAKPSSSQKQTHNRPTQPNTVCNIQQQNPITGETRFGELVQDVLTVDGVGHGQHGQSLTVDNFLFSCSPEYFVKGLVNDAKGVLGFGRSKLSFHTQMVNSFEFVRKFTVCLSSSKGFITSGTGGLNSILYTPLISTPGSDGYYVNVNSVKINGRRLAVIQPIGAVEISSTAPYTVLKSTVYEIFKKAFVSAAKSMNMTLVSSRNGFEVCFRSRAAVPEVELVLQSELVRWRMKGRDLMVEVSDEAMCLGVVDGGLGMDGLMILGGYQLEDHLLEFNLGTGMMGFSDSLLKGGNSCSKLRDLVSTPVESL